MKGIGIPKDYRIIGEKPSGEIIVEKIVSEENARDVAELVRAGSREDTYILLEGQNLKFECDLGMTSVPGRYRLKLTYKIERLQPTGEEVNPT